MARGALKTASDARLRSMSALTHQFHAESISARSAFRRFPEITLTQSHSAIKRASRNPHKAPRNNTRRRSIPSLSNAYSAPVLSSAYWRWRIATSAQQTMRHVYAKSGRERPNRARAGRNRSGQHVRYLGDPCLITRTPAQLIARTKTINLSMCR